MGGGTPQPVLLGLIVAPSTAGLTLAVAVVLAFLARTPLRVVLVDRHRHRWLDRTKVAAWVGAVELVLAAASLAAASLLTSHPFWVPVVVAGPLAAVELWYDARSRSRRLVPELAGSISVCSMVAMIVLAGGGEIQLAVGLWLV